MQSDDKVNVLVVKPLYSSNESSQDRNVNRSEGEQNLSLTVFIYTSTISHPPQSFSCCLQKKEIKQRPTMIVNQQDF